MAISVPWLSICPRLHKHHQRLIASTAWGLRLLTLGMIHRQVIVDPKQEVVILRGRWLWLFTRRRRIPFRFIQAVTYGYQDLAPGWPWTWAHESADLFRVGLRLHDLEEVHLFFFYGDGTFTHDGPLPDWIYWWDSLSDAARPCGTQERESLAFVEVLSKLIGVPVEPGRA